MNLFIFILVGDRGWVDGRNSCFDQQSEDMFKFSFFGTEKIFQPRASDYCTDHCQDKRDGGDNDFDSGIDVAPMDGRAGQGQDEANEQCANDRHDPPNVDLVSYLRGQR